MGPDDHERLDGMEPVPEQDIRFGDPEAAPTAWADVRRVLATAELFWISTVRADGRPHVAPLAAVWYDDRLHFCTGPQEQKAVNIARNPRVVLTTGCNLWKEGLDVVVEGTAVPVTDESRLRGLARTCGVASTTATGTSRSRTGCFTMRMAVPPSSLASLR